MTNQKHFANQKPTEFDVLPPVTTALWYMDFSEISCSGTSYETFEYANSMSATNPMALRIPMYSNPLLRNW